MRSKVVMSRDSHLTKQHYRRSVVSLLGELVVFLVRPYLIFMCDTGFLLGL